MKYYSSAFPVLASTDGVAYEIYLAGCKGYCKGCHSPHTHDPNIGIEITEDYMQKLTSDIQSHYDKGLVDNICILGGEPLDNSDVELAVFIIKLKSRFPSCKFWLYTHFELDEVKTYHPEVLKLLDYIKCGKYEEELKSEAGFKDAVTGVTLATSNQHIYKLK